ncbi:MAG: multifunctional CCA tRNA nucleotidyl transferase/2'3'-cyclic phosphodiesterase/2'nucleotidase/phosphatase [Pseudomonadales bacterium]
MEIYLVGGAVRDELLGLPVNDRDWVVVGATSAQMLELGYSQVGRDFPVFLHPDSHEEYALARTERKSGPGHKGFVVHAGVEVTLEEDLIRRDLTVNAMARAADGALIDPYGGFDDLQSGTLRHVSEAFSEDPLRVLRVARFAAQLPGTTVAPATAALMQQLVEAGALRELPAERVAQELDKLLGKRLPPARFLEVLRDVGGLADWFAELSDCSGAIPAALHDADLRFAALCRGLSAESVQALCERLKASNRRSRIALQSVRFDALLRDWRAAPAAQLCAALQEMTAFKNDEWQQQAAAVIGACAAVSLEHLFAAVSEINRTVVAKDLLAQGLKGPALGQALQQARERALALAQQAV